MLLVSCSLNAQSRSRRLADHANQVMVAAGVTVDYIDLRDLALPLCNGFESAAHPAVQPLRERVVRADGAILAVPIYNFDVNAACKNFIELTGRAWSDKVVGFMCAAGGRNSYMSVMALASSLMLDFRCVIVPRFVYASKADFDPQLSAEVTERVEALCVRTTEMATRLK
jgi:FMN reductase